MKALHTYFLSPEDRNFVLKVWKAYVTKLKDENSFRNKLDMDAGKSVDTYIYRGMSVP